MTTTHQENTISESDDRGAWAAKTADQYRVIAEGFAPGSLGRQLNLAEAAKYDDLAARMRLGQEGTR